MKTHNKILSLLLALILCVSMVLMAACDSSVALDATAGQGEKGDQGEKGEKGDKGDAGVGKSAYDLAVENGFDGTVEEWLASLTDLTGNNSNIALNVPLDYYLLPDDTYGVSIGMAKYLEEIIIPAKYNEKPVSRILSGGFSNCEFLKKITIPDSVKTIDANSFTGSKLLSVVDISNGVTNIGGSAFFGCTGLTSITIPNSVTSIGDYAFRDCSNLMRITFGGSKSEWGLLNQTNIFPQNCSVICNDGPIEDSWAEVNYTIYSITDSLNIRSYPSFSSSPIGRVNLGTPLTAIAMKDDWYKISYENCDAYVSAEYVTTNANEITFIDLTNPQTLVIKYDNEYGSNIYVNLRSNLANTDSPYITISRSNTLNGELKKVAVNTSGNIWKVSYNNEIYYIKSGAFRYFE